jgi:hypothetical protein
VKAVAAQREKMKRRVLAELDNSIIVTRNLDGEKK